MTATQIQIIRSSWQIAAEEPLATGILFYDRLFSLSPQLRGIFRSPMSGQTIRFMQTVGYIVNQLEKTYEIENDIPDIKYLSQAYGLKPKHYALIKDSLLWAIEKRLGSLWNERTKDAWMACYKNLTELMISVEVAA